jgi:hypothetical protein
MTLSCNNRTSSCKNPPFPLKIENEAAHTTLIKPRMKRGLINPSSTQKVTYLAVDDRLSQNILRASI